MLPNAITVAGTLPDTHFATPLAELQAREAEIAGHLRALNGGEHQAVIGEQLLVIRDKKLYRAAGFKSLKAYLAAQRTPMSRSRGYQVMAFAVKRRLAAQAGGSLPSNERQGRACRDKADQSDSFEKRWGPIFRYLYKKFLSFPEHEHAHFAEVLKVNARFFAAQAQCGKASTDGRTPPACQTETVVTASAAKP